MHKKEEGEGEASLLFSGSFSREGVLELISGNSAKWRYFLFGDSL